MVPGSSKRERARKPESVAAESVPAGGGRRRVGPTRGAHTSAAGAGRKGRGAGPAAAVRLGPRPTWARGERGGARGAGPEVGPGGGRGRGRRGLCGWAAAGPCGKKGGKRRCPFFSSFFL